MFNYVRDLIALDHFLKRIYELNCHKREPDVAKKISQCVRLYDLNTFFFNLKDVLLVDEVIYVRVSYGEMKFIDAQMKQYILTFIASLVASGGIYFYFHIIH